MSRPVLRFAPSPNGRLHLGHAYSALLNEAFARELDGELLLRIEDIDPVRSRPDLVAAISGDLRWLGLAFPEPVRRQSAHMAEYRQIRDGLAARGLVFPCFCSRGDIARVVAAAGATWPRDPDGAPLYPGTCRKLSERAVEARLAEGLRPAWRLRTRRALAGIASPLAWRRFDRGGTGVTVEARPELWGDPVVARRDVPTSYHLSVVLDDAAQGVTHVVRGLDLQPATDLHVLLQAVLGLPSPDYHHHGLLRGPDGAKLAKSRGSPSLAALREAGTSPGEVRTMLGFQAS